MEPIDIFIYLSYALVVIAAAGAIILPLINALGDPKTLIKSGAGILAIALIFAISWAIAKGDVTSIYAKFNVGPSLSKMVGGSIIMMYFLIGISVVSIFFTEISKIFK